MLNFGGLMRVVSFIFCIQLLVGATAVGAYAYDEIQVTEGGTIVGKVTMLGAKPTPKGLFGQNLGIG